MKIGHFEITQKTSPFIIAEVGINHNGELDKMLRMIETAKACGADCVKFQSFKADEFCGDKRQTYTYKSQGKEVTESMYEMFKRVELKEEYLPIIKKKCEEEGIIFMSTPQNKSDLDRLLKVGVPAIKVGSDDFITLPLLDCYKQTGLPMIISCGMADLDEIKIVMEHFVGYPVALLLCTSQYPTPFEDVNLNKLKTLRNEFPNLILGFSDHTQGTLAASVAVGMGAVIFEKHFTLSKDLPGPDHWFSSEPDELKDWCASIRNAYKLLGTEVVKPTAEECKMRDLARRKIIAKKDIKKDNVILEDDIELKRAANGLNALFWDKIIHSKATKDIKCGTVINKDDFNG